MFLSPSDVRSQGKSTASAAGTVRDASGEAVAGARVVITQTNTGFSQSTNSSADGSFAFPVLPVGNYQLGVTKEGFASYEQTGITLSVSQPAQFSITLQVGTVEQIIHVTAAASPVNTTNGELSQLINQEQVVDLPLNGRNPAELEFLAPGVTNPTQNAGSIGPGLNLQFSYPVGIGGNNTSGVGLGGPGLSQGALAPAVNGARSGGVYYSLDGATNMDPYGVTSGPFPNPDAVQEFRVMTNGYGADYVSAPGGAVNIVTKSGTNDFHGNAFEFLRNGVLNARNYFAATRDNIKRNQFGGTAGGPIRRDKFFIFGAYQRTALVSDVGGNIQFVPTDAERAGDFSAIPTQLHNPYTGAPFPGNQIPVSDFSPVTSMILAHLPHSTAPDGRVEVRTPSDQYEDQGTLKLDYVLNKHSTLLGRYFVSDYRNPGVVNPQNWLTATGPNAIRWQDLMIGYDYASGEMTNQARFTFQRNGYHVGAGLQVSFAQLGTTNFTPPTPPFIEFMQVAGFFTIGGGSVNNFPRNTYTASDRLSFVHGRNQISVGAEMSRLQDTDYTNHTQSGIAVWAPLPPFPPVQPFLSFTSGNQISDFVLGKATVFAQGDGLNAETRGTLWGFYGEDQIRITRRFNLTLGLRWDPYWPFHALNGRATCFRAGEQSTVFTNAPVGELFPGDPGCNGSGGLKSDLYTTLQPRIGFAYSPDQGKTAIRGGFGLYTVQFPMQSFLPFANQPPYIRNSFAMFPPSIANPWGNFPGGNPFANGFTNDQLPRPSDVAFPLSSVSVFDHNFKLATVKQWNATVEHMFWGNTIVRASYVGTSGSHSSLNVDKNAAIYIPGLCNGSPCSTMANEQARRPFQGIQHLYNAESVGTSSYNALQLGIQRRMSGGLTFLANYTWSKCLDYISVSANGTLLAGFNTVSDPFNVHAYHALCDYDVPQSFSTAFVWQLPSFKSGNLAKQILSHWQASGIWLWQDGQPFSIYSGFDNSLTGVGADYADQVPGVSPHLSPDRPRSEVVQEYFNVNAFQPNAVGTFGNLGRNILFGPGYMNIDFAVMKIISFKDRFQLTIRGEFFNLTNTPHFEAPNGAGNPGGLHTAEFGQIIGARDPRIVQIALKLNW